MDLGEALRTVRSLYDLTLEQLCEEIGIASRSISSMENGKKCITLLTLNKYSRRFGITISSISYLAEQIELNKELTLLEKFSFLQFR